MGTENQFQIPYEKTGGTSGFHLISPRLPVAYHMQSPYIDTNAGNPNHREDFTQLLGKAAKKKQSTD